MLILIAPLIMALSELELKACVADLQRMPADRRYNGLGEAWNTLHVRERYGVLKAIADIEEQDVTPEELRSLAQMEDEILKPSGLGEGSCLPSALVTDTRAVWKSLTMEERELVFHELHTAL